MLTRQWTRELAHQSPWNWLLLSLVLWIPALTPLSVQSEESSLSWADKMLSERDHDFGTPPAGTAASHSIKIRNIYKETVTISEVASSSSMFNARLDKSSIASTETAMLTLSLEASAPSNPSEATISMKMTFDGVNYKTVTVPVTAFVAPGAVVPKPANHGGNWAEQMFSDLKYDFGPVARGAEAKHVIEITNLYAETVTLSGPVSSCQCISPLLDKFQLKSRESARLTLNLDTIRHSKKRDVTVSLDASFAGGDVKQIRIPITAYIRQDVVLDPGSVQFGVVSPGEAVERRLRVLYAGRDSWTVRSVRVRSTHVTSEIKEVARGNGRVEYELLVKLDGTAPKGQLIDQLVLETDDLNNPTIPVLISGTVETDLQVTPEVVQFGQLQPGVPKVVKVVVKGRKPFRIEKVECDSPSECYGVALSPLDQTVQIVSLTITPPDEPGELKEGFTVSVAGRQTTLAFRAVGMIEASTVPSPAVNEPAVTAPAATEPVPDSQESAPAESKTPP